MMIMIKVSFTLSPLLLLHLFLLFSGELTLASAVIGGGRAAVRIPEHTCHKLIDLTACNQQSCTGECSREAYGLGVCKDSVCFCTFYCKEPPV